MARSTRITIETESLMIFRDHTSSRLRCTHCAVEVEMIALKGAALLSKLLPREMNEWLNSGDLHRSQSPDGSVWICLNSLVACLRGEQTK